MTTLFISDLHLDEKRPTITAAFLHLLETQASQAEALYILGDFFEAWVGDDHRSPLTDQVFPVLRQLTGQGVPVYLMQGNRDFLFGDGICQATGCQLLKDPTVIDLYGKPTLLMHGDSLCTNDLTYMKLRPVLRSRIFKFILYCLPLSVRLWMVRKARAKSKNRMAYKTAELMDADLNTIKMDLQRHQAKILIHGHTHQPTIQYLVDNEQQYTRIVLSDWYEQANVLVCEPNGEFRLIYPSSQL